MSWGLPKGSANAGAPLSGKAARLRANGARNKTIRGAARPGKGWAKDPKGPRKK